MPKIPNPHDKLFREIWSKKENAIDFLKNYLPANLLDKINLQTLAIEKDSFVDKHLKESYSDLLYNVQFEKSKGFIYILFEHKSYPEKYTALQLLKYMVSIWELFLKQNKGQKLPLILPLIIYHGTPQWKFGSRFLELLNITDDDFKIYIPDFEFLLYDISHKTDDEIRGAVLSRAVLMLLGAIQKADFAKKLPEIFKLLDELLKQERGLDYIRTILYYITQSTDKIQPEELARMIHQNLSAGEKIMPTIAEQWIQQGIEQGMERGKIEARLEDARKMLDKGFSLQDVLEITGLTRKILKENGIISSEEGTANS
jgi:predicted transposase/invertase (TIGR01784 family)